ncbi:MAG TPA: hypothetical protein DEV93_18555 [Chloroflexi bacterium]|jgi:hypothetical protein|nr:hypothetical protein [Chloroflexota bacterium]
MGAAAEKAEARIKDDIGVHPAGMWEGLFFGRNPGDVDIEEQLTMLVRWVAGIHQEVLRMADDIETLRGTAGASR